MKIEYTIELDDDEREAIEQFWIEYPNTGKTFEEVIVWCAEHYANG